MTNKLPRTLSNIPAISFDRVSKTCSPSSGEVSVDELEDAAVVPVVLTLEKATSFTSISFSRTLACFRSTVGFWEFDSVISI